MAAAVVMQFIFLDSKFSPGIIRNIARLSHSTLPRERSRSKSSRRTAHNTRAMIFWPIWWSSYKTDTWQCGLCRKCSRLKARVNIWEGSTIKRPAVFFISQHRRSANIRAGTKCSSSAVDRLSPHSKSVIKRQDLTGLFRQGTKDDNQNYTKTWRRDGAETIPHC